MTMSIAEQEFLQASHHRLLAPPLHDQILTAANIGIYCNHFFHNFCVWGRVYNRRVHTGPAFVPSCPMCSGIPDRRKLKERISSQAACILADQPPDSRLATFTGRCPLAFRSEADRARSFYGPSLTTIIYTANDAHPDGMIMVKYCCQLRQVVLHVAGQGSWHGRGRH
jgi:hypothetical protein